MSSARSHRELIVWQKAMDRVVQVHRLTDSFPRVEVYRPTSQLTRAAVSVPADIAEGNARGSDGDYAHFLSIARGSLMETETFLLLAVRSGYITQEQAEPALPLVVEISRMLTVLRARIAGR